MTRADAITGSVITNSLSAYCEETAEALLHTSRNPTLSVGHDFSIGFTDADADLVTGGAGVPCHLASIDMCVERMLEAVGGVNPGDVLLTNDPYEGRNTHLADFTLATPVVDDGGDPVLWVVVRAHQADIGAVDPASMATTAETIYHEGLRIPPLKLVDGGDRQEGVVRLIVGNSRLESIQRGDLLAMVGAARKATRLVDELVEKYAADTVRETVADLLATTEAEARAHVRDLQDGTYEGESWSDTNPDTGEEVHVRAVVTVDGDDLTVDFAGSDPQVRGVTNNSLAVTHAAVNGAWFSVADLDFPLNAGAFRMVDVVAPEGTVVNPEFPAGTAYATITSYQETVEAVWDALAEAAPRETPAGYARMVRPVMSGHDPDSGEPYSQLQLNVMGGGGAIWGCDGPQSVAGTVGFRGGRAIDPEVQENLFPYRIHGTELRTDSGGAGRWRGGLGPTVSIVPLDHEAVFSVGGDFGRSVRPAGHLGGEAGDPPSVRVRRENGAVEEVPHAFVNLDIGPGDTYVQDSGGGGGVGDPHDRPPERVRRDVRNGYVSRAAAREEYGVAFEPDSLAIDRERTAELRDGDGSFPSSGDGPDPSAGGDDADPSAGGDDADPSAGGDGADRSAGGDGADRSTGGDDA
ncbi:MAG: hydantoinase B/oxoprolinase family protein [Haloplanus sp.]